ncbi:hypothetical protein [Nocardia sp. NPDC058497]|uniref:hypothetical protein n=1 Tax=Nocardia sp. NPDC058497 TaxID=3346529 RepID=UPI00364D1032
MRDPGCGPSSAGVATVIANSGSAPACCGATAPMAKANAAVASVVAIRVIVRTSGT